MMESFCLFFHELNQFQVLDVCVYIYMNMHVSNKDRDSRCEMVRQKATPESGALPSRSLGARAWTAEGNALGCLMHLISL